MLVNVVYSGGGASRPGRYLFLLQLASTSASVRLRVMPVAVTDSVVSFISSASIAQSSSALQIHPFPHLFSTSHFSYGHMDTYVIPWVLICF